ncbi:hypothetical protein [Burkholderia sp. LMG 32019]|uniref:hypothetical protein n=1 Tax=Burkholderia sp. LMG 32019 TaxID=3158173 RepID=UPI003C2B0752
MVNDVLDLLKVGPNQMVLGNIKFRMRSISRDVAEIFRPFANAKHRTLACRLSLELTDGYVGDPVRLQRIVTNHVSNAIKFTKLGGVTIDARLARACGVS